MPWTNEKPLIPCPFCGREPETTSRPDNAEESMHFAAISCHCGGYSACAYQSATASTKEAAEALVTSLWNTREPLPLPVPEDEDLVEMQKFVHGASMRAAPFFPHESQTLGGFVLACCAEIRKLRLRVATAADLANKLATAAESIQAGCAGSEEANTRAEAAHTLASKAGPEGAAPAGEASTLPGAPGFTMACFQADKVPAGTKVYTAPPQTPFVPVTQLDALARRNVFDAVRGAYDLGYSDARAARSVPGDSAPGYHGRDVETDHGEALLTTLNRRLAARSQPDAARAALPPAALLSAPNQE